MLQYKIIFCTAECAFVEHGSQKHFLSSCLSEVLKNNKKENVVSNQNDPIIKEFSKGNRATITDFHQFNTVH